MQDKRKILETERPFSYKQLKTGSCQIFYNNKLIMTVKPKDSGKILKFPENSLETQMILAKITGHFKH
jgi:hypothetical protein